MHVKESVKEFVQDVKRKFSSKRKRETTCSADTCDETSSCLSTDGFSSSSSSSSLSSQPSIPERNRLTSLIRSRSVSTFSRKPQQAHHNTRELDGKRYRFFSTSSRPSPRSPSSSSRTHASDESHRGADYWPPRSIQDTEDDRLTFGSSQGGYTNIIDIRSDRTASTVGEAESRHFSSATSHSQPSGRGSNSDTSGTLVSSAKSISHSDSSYDSICLHSEKISVQVHDIAPLILISPPPMAQDTQVSPLSTHKQLSAPLPSLPEEEITLALSLSSQSPAAGPNIDKPTPAPPLSPPPPAQVSRATTPAQHTRSVPGSPAPVIPRLTAPSMFLPIPNTDPLNPLLTKHVPPEQRPRRDVVGEYAGRDMHEMVMSNSWRALARMARDRIVASDPEDLGRILDLWSLRLSSLARLRLTNQASAECTNLFAVLNAVPVTSVPGSFPGSGTLPPSTPLPHSPAPAAPSPLSPSGLSGLVQLPGTPFQGPATLPGVPTPGGGTSGSGLGSTSSTVPARRHHAHVVHDFMHPFELTVFHARVHYWAGDPLGYVDALSQILAWCKERAREEGRAVAQWREMRERTKLGGGGKVDGTHQSEETDEDKSEKDTGEGEEAVEETRGSEQSTEVQDEEEEHDEVLAAAEANLSMWLERVARVCLILASQMIEMNEYQSAINLLAPLCTYRAPPAFLPTRSPALHSALARIYLLSGNLQKAEEHFSVAASVAGNGVEGTDIVMNTALLAAASGDWTRAEEALQEVVSKDPGNSTAVNNLAVVLLCQGRVKEGIDLLEAALNTSPSSVVVAEPFLFNLSTMYELRSTTSIDKKCQLLVEVAKWSGDGLKTSCLKMPSS